MNIIKVKNKYGMTLAEVLLTLTIVGSIASLTIPPLVMDLQEAQYRTAWKKTFSVLSQAAVMLYVNQIDVNFSTNSGFRSAFGNILSIVKNDTRANMFSAYYYCYRSSKLCYNSANDTAPCSLLADGVAIRFNSFGNATGNGYCTEVRGNVTGICGELATDINGPDPPNMFGVDQFSAWFILKNGAYSVKAEGDGDGRTCEAGSTTSNTSAGCAKISLMNSPMPK